MKILYFGNFTRSFSTENYVAYALGRLGQEVVKIPNTQFDVWEACKHRIMQEAPDVVLFSKAPVCHTDRILDLCNGHNILSVCWHWDLYFGCGNRSNERWPQLRSDLLFSTDGGHDRKFKNAGYSHQVLRQGIHYPEAIIQPPDYQYDVGFVGHNSEFQPGRPELIAHLSDTYGSRFSYVSNVRGLKLNKWLSQVKVVVGDSYPSDEGAYWCVDSETEVLTQRGWKTCWDVTCNDYIYTLNRVTQRGEWQQPSNIYLKKVNTTMVSLESKSHSSLTTPNHRWWVTSSTTERTNSGIETYCAECGRSFDTARGFAIHNSKIHGIKIKPRTQRKLRSGFKTTSTLLAGDSVPLGSLCCQLPKSRKYSNSFVALVAWAYTEGSVLKNTRYTAITQSDSVNSDYVSEIYAALEDEYGQEDVGKPSDTTSPHWKVHRYEDRGMVSFALRKYIGDALWKAAPNKKVTPEFIMSLTKEQLKIFVVTSIKADGCIKTSKHKGRLYRGYTLFQLERSQLDAFEMACSLLGKSVSTRPCRDGGYLSYIKKSRRSYPLKGQEPKEMQYSGSLWCPTVANSIWLARRNGNIYFTGNSNRVYEVLGRGGFLLHPKVEGLEREFQSEKHLGTYTRDNFAELDDTINYYLCNTPLQEAIRQAGHEHCRTNYTYFNRCKTLLAYIGAKCPSLI